MAAERMNELAAQIEKAQGSFRALILNVGERGGLTEERYARYLTMQYHLTKGVQRHFFAAAAHIDFARRKSFREFLVNFAIEEELHFEIARKDLENMGVSPGPCPLDVRLWWSFFDGIVQERPCVRLGATAILENIATGANDLIDKLMAKASYLSPRNTRFVQIHRHGDVLPHGDQILEALRSASLEERHWNDLVEGANIGRTLYLRMADWALDESRGEWE